MYHKCGSKKNITSMYNNSTGRFEAITLSFFGGFHLVGHGSLAIYTAKNLGRQRSQRVVA